MMEAILRPGRSVSVPQPAYALELNEILEANGWRRLFGLTPLESQTERQLRRAIAGIHKRQRTVSDAARALQRQRAEAHMLQGALASSRARRATNQALAGRDDGRALREFQRVLQIETHQRDAEAKECEAFQFLRLGQYALAEEAYREVEAFALAVGDARKRDLTVARAKRYRAQIIQIRAVNGATAARTLIGATAQPSPESALRLRARYAPYLGWDAVEQAEMHYVAAYISSRLGAGLIEAAQLGASEGCYRDVLDRLPKRLIFVDGWTRALRAEANAGLDRITLARNDKYDEAWLMQPSDKPQ